MAITRRDTIVAGFAVLATCGVGAAAQTTARLGPATFDWAKMEARPTEVGAIRNLVRQPTATLDELEIHITTLNPGLASHPPHTHPNEELVIVREGTVEVLNAGMWKRLGPGSVIFNASNSPHALRNVGATAATYHVINWKPPATPAN